MPKGKFKPRTEGKETFKRNDSKPKYSKADFKSDKLRTKADSFRYKKDQRVKKNDQAERKNNEQKSKQDYNIRRLNVIGGHAQGLATILTGGQIGSNAVGSSQILNSDDRQSDSKNNNNNQGMIDA